MQVEAKTQCRFFNECGGCDFLDLSQDDYHNLKKVELLKTLTGLQVPEIEYCFIGPKSRRRITLHIDTKNHLGFFAKKSRNLVEIEDCFIAEEKVSNLILPLKKFVKSQATKLFNKVSITLFDNGLEVILHASKELNFIHCQKAMAFAKEHDVSIYYQVNNQITPIYVARVNQIFYPDLKIDLSSKVFIQATMKGLDKINEIIRQFLIDNKSIKNVADVYAGFGAYSFAIHDLVHVDAYEGSGEMVGLMNKNASENSISHKIRAVEKDLYQDALTKRELEKLDLVIINPPRNGATPQIREIAKSQVKNVIYVSCNPQTFAFDAKILIEAGFKIEALTALDQFHASKHLELVAVLRK